MATAAQYQRTGKRKTSVARVILCPGDGNWQINGRTLDSYFPRLVHRTQVVTPLRVAGLEGQYDIRVRVHGGGPTGQAGAVRHEIGARSSRPTHSCGCRSSARASSRATRGRSSARRPACTKARKAPQFSKR